MTEKTFMEILSRTRGISWILRPTSKEKFGVPSGKWFIEGMRRSLKYSPITAVATLVRRDFVDVSNQNVRGILKMDPETFKRIEDAIYQKSGYSRPVRRELLKLCGGLDE